MPRLPAPNLTLTDTGGRRVGLPARLRGRISAVQLMFAGCSSTCPIQGTIFAAAAVHVRTQGIQFLSLTVDPLDDSLQVLRSWLVRFGNPATWTATTPRVEDVDALAAFLRGAAANRDRHSSQVFLFERDARLAFRAVELPASEHVAELLDMLARA